MHISTVWKYRRLLWRYRRYLPVLWKMKRHARSMASVPLAAGIGLGLAVTLMRRRRAA